MALERKTTALEFETMLRRHLRRGGAPVSACAGFDPDRASAYLEGALGGNARGRYEAHLAGCPACRRHIIELSRLSQLALQPEAVPVLAGRWPRWRSSLAERIDHWVDPSSWRLNWPVAGTVLAGCAILTFAMITRPSRQASLLSGKVSIATTSKQDVGPSAAVEVPSPTQLAQNGDNPSNMDKQSLPAAAPAIAPYSAGDAETNQVSALPKPSQAIPPPRIAGSPNHVSSDAAQMRAVEQSQRLSGAIEALGEIARKDQMAAEKQEHNLEPASPPPAMARRRASQEARAEGSAAPRPMTFGQGSEVIDENRNKVRSGQLSPSIAMPRMTPNPEYNPMQSGLREREMPKAKNERGSPPNQKNSIISTSLSHIVDYMKSYWPWHRPNYIERSLVPGKDAMSDDDNENNENSSVRKDNRAFVPNIDFNKSKNLIRHLRGKTFRHVRGVWIDDQYDAEMSAWRLTWLRRGSEAYSRVLAEEPQLKEFFDFGPIIIVWQDKIYRVN
jgi:hypothetical protein